MSTRQQPIVTSELAKVMGYKNQTFDVRVYFVSAKSLPDSDVISVLTVDGRLRADGLRTYIPDRGHSLTEQHRRLRLSWPRLYVSGRREYALMKAGRPYCL